MPCHPHDALVYLIENHHAYLEADRPESNAIFTDILDRLDTSERIFVDKNNRMFRALFINYRCAISRMFDSEDITQDDLLRWMAISPRNTDDKISLQNNQLSTDNVSLVAKIRECSERKAMRLLKGSGGDVLGALVNDGERNNEEECRLRTIMYVKLMLEVGQSLLYRGLALTMPYLGRQQVFLPLPSKEGIKPQPRSEKASSTFVLCFVGLVGLVISFYFRWHWS